MEPEKFKEQFDHANDVAFGGRNNRVVLVTNNPSVGGRCRIPIENVSSGFDWEKGDIIISVKDEIYSKQVNQDTFINSFLWSLDNSIFEKIKNSQSDSECRRVLLEKLAEYKKRI